MVTEKNPEVIGGMFNRIARRYDLLNHLLSMGIDKRWRRALVRELVREKAGLVLDMATGTADLALMAVRAGIDKVKGVDIADAMLDIGRSKIRKAALDARISLQNGRAEEIPFEDHTFDGAMVAFGVRNFEDLDKGLNEMHRVLKPGGSISVLEFSLPENRLIRASYMAYFRHVLPTLGGWISGDKGAYSYLPASVLTFPQGKDFLDRLERAGFQQVSCRRFTFGIASLYRGYRKD